MRMGGDIMIGYLRLDWSKQTLFLREKGLSKKKKIDTRRLANSLSLIPHPSSLLLFLIFILIFIAFAFPVSAQATVTVSIGDVCAIPNSSVNVPIMVKNVTNLGSGTIDVSYNPEIVHVTEVTSGTGNALKVQAWNINNTIGLVQIVAWDTNAPHSGDVIFANVTYKAVASTGSTPLNITVRKLKEYEDPYPQIPHTVSNGTFTITLLTPGPYMIYGWTFFDSGMACSNPNVTITNLNTSKQWQAETHAGYNYYRRILDSTNASAGDMLEFNVTDGDGTQYNITNHTVTEGEINNGGLFEFNVTLESPYTYDIVINEFEQDPHSSDSGKEWVELYNNGTESVNISNWELIDGYYKKEVVIPSGATILGKGYYTINWTNGALINSKGENITLYDIAGSEVDKTLTAIDTENDDRCWARVPNGYDTDSDTDWEFQQSTRNVSNNIYDVSITSVPTEQTTAPNVNATYTLTITNPGNVADTIKLNITENEADFGSLRADTFSLNAGENATAYLNVSASDAGIYNTTVRATSQGNASVFDEVTVKTNVTALPTGAPNITDRHPVETFVYDAEGAARTFNITVNQTVDVRWEINGSVVKDTEKGVTEASYTNTSAVAGYWNVSTIATNVNGCDMQTWMWNVTSVIPSQLPAAPYMIYGRIFYANNSECNNPAVNVTNLNTNKKWQADSQTSSNYYRLILATDTDVNASEVLQFNVTAPEGSPLYTTEHTVTAEEINNGGIFNFNFSSGVTAPTLVSYTITNRTITPPQRTEIDVKFSEKVKWAIAIEDGGGGVYDWTGTSTNPTPKIWNGTYEPNGTIVPNGIYTVNITWMNTTTGLGGQNNTEKITVSSVGAPNITSFVPLSPVCNNETESRTFTIEINQTVNVSWQINGSVVQTNTSVTESSYTNTSASVGTWNVSAIVSNANGADMHTWIWIVTPVTPSLLPATPFLLCGRVFYANNSECNNPLINVTNLNTGEKWQAETNATYNYYQLVLASGTELNASEILRFNVTSPDENQSNSIEHTVTLNELNNGGLFNFNISLKSPLAPTIISYAPSTHVSNNESESRTFNITIDQAVNVSWSINGSYIYTNESTTEASYTNTSAVAGYWNVSAIATNANGSDIQTWWWTVTASATYGLNLTTAPTQQFVYENEDANYTITIKNTGSKKDTFNLTVTNTSADFAKLTKSIVPLDPNTSTDVTLTVRDSNSGTYLTTVTGTSVTNTSENSSVTVITNVFAVPTYSVRISSDESSRSVEQNENASYILTIENTGNQPDTYNLTVYNQSGTNANLNKTELALESGCSANVILNVSGSTVGTDYVALVTVASSHASASVDTKTSIIEALDLTVDASMRFVNTSEVATYILTLENTGNKLHNYTLTKSEPGADKATLNAENVSLEVEQFKEIMLNVSSATTGCYAVTVTATDTQDSSKTASITTTTIVTTAPVYGVSLSVDNTSQSVNTSEIASYILRINNVGNQPDIYNLTLINPRADTAALSKYVTSNLSAGASETIFLDVSDAEGGSYEVKVIAESQSDPGKQDSVTTTTNVLNYGVVITADSISKTSYVGNIVTFTLSIENAGNTADSFDLTLSKQAELDTAYLSHNTTAELAPHASEDITLTIKDNTTDAYCVEIIATSQADSSKNDSIEVTAAFKRTLEFGVALSVSPASKKVEKNEEALYTIHVINTGNVEDTYTINTTRGMLGKSSLTVSAGGTASTTLIMNGTELKTYTAVVSLSSQSQHGLSETKSVSLTVIPVVSIEPLPASRTLYPGNASTFMLTIKNTGTSSHTYDLNVTNTSDTAELSARSLSLAKGETAEVTLTMNDSAEGVHTATVTATDKEDPCKKASITVSTLYLKQIVRGVDLKVDEGTRTIEQGKYALYVLTINNLGNKHDTFDLNIVSNETTAELTKDRVSLRASGEVGDTATVKLNVSSAEVGEYAVNVKAVSQNDSSVSDIVETSTKVAGTSGTNNIVNSKVDETSTITNSNVTRSTIVCSLITNSTITDSEITDSGIYNSTVEDTALEDVKLEHATVTAGNITAGKITIEGITYEITEEITISDVVTGSDEEDSSVAGSEADTTKIVSPNSDSQFEIGNNKSYVGGSLKAQRSTVPTAGKSTLSLGTGEYISIDVSDNIKESMEWVIINLTYDENNIPGGVEESTMRLSWYNETSDEWVRLECAGNPSWCYGAGVNTDANYVWANVSHFSEYGAGGEPALPPPTLTAWYNNKTENNLTEMMINESECVFFNATADQAIDVWSWFVNGTNQSHNFDNFYYCNWMVNGTYYVAVNARSVNGTSNTIIWTVTVNDIAPPAKVQNLTNSTPTTTAVDLRWDANTELDVVGYKVYQNGSLLSTTTTTYYNVTALSASTPYEFNVSAYDDNGLDGENATVMVTMASYLAPNITSFAPPTPVYDTEGATRAFNISINQTVNVSWQINGTEVFDQSGVNFSEYINTSAIAGTWNVTAIAANENGTDMQTWWWTVKTSIVVSKSLSAGWNLISPPKVLANNSWGNITGLGDGLNYSIAYRYRYDGASGKWEQMKSNTEFKPLEAIFVKMNSQDVMEFVWTTDPLTVPPARELPKGWNLIGLNDMNEVKVDVALRSIEVDDNGDPGYSTAYSPAYNSAEWTYPGESPVPYMKPYEGYWVFMDHADTLAGRMI